MKKESIKRILAGVVCAATVFVGSMPAFAAENVIGSETENKTADVAVTATVASNFKVKLPMAIELEEQAEAGEYGPVFSSPETTKIGVQGVLYGKYLNVAVKDVREGSDTFDQENKLTLAHANYDSETGVYEVISEKGAVSADIGLQYHKFYPADHNVNGVTDATNIVSGGSTDVYTNYDFDVTTTSRICADGPTLYYGKMTFFISTVDC